jgi:hypothetical protein
MYAVRVKTSHGRGGLVSNIVFDHINVIQNDNNQNGPNSIVTISMFGGNRPHLFTGYHWDDITVMENILFDHLTIYPSNTNIDNLGNYTNDATAITTTSSSPLSTLTGNGGIHLLGDTNLRKYWSSPFTFTSSATTSNNEYIRNITFQNIINLATTSKTKDSIVPSLQHVGLVDHPVAISTSTSTASKLLLEKEQLEEAEEKEEHEQQQQVQIVNSLPIVFDCINAINVQLNHQNMICETKPYMFLSYALNQLGRAVHKLLR